MEDIEQLPGQMSIFDFIDQPVQEIPLDELPEPEMVRMVSEATGLNFQRRELSGYGGWYEAKLGKVKHTVHYSNYSIDDHRRFISVGWDVGTAGGGGPTDSLTDAIEWFKARMRAHK